MTYLPLRRVGAKPAGSRRLPIRVSMGLDRILPRPGISPRDGRANGSSQCPVPVQVEWRKPAPSCASGRTHGGAEPVLPSRLTYHSPVCGARGARRVGRLDVAAGRRSPGHCAGGLCARRRTVARRTEPNSDGRAWPRCNHRRQQCLEVLDLEREPRDRPRGGK